MAAVGRDYLVLVVLSCVIATFGPVVTSAAVIIGAMLVAPLMPPIPAFAPGLVRADLNQVWRAQATLLAGLLLAVLLSTLLGLGVSGTIFNFSRPLRSSCSSSRYAAAAAGAADTHSETRVERRCYGVGAAIGGQNTSSQRFGDASLSAVSPCSNPIVNRGAPHVVPDSDTALSTQQGSTTHPAAPGCRILPMLIRGDAERSGRMADEPALSHDSRPSWSQRLFSRNAVRLVLGLLLLLLFTLFVVENARTVRIRFIFFETNTWLAWALVLAGVVGCIVGLLLPRLRRFI